MNLLKITRSFISIIILICLCSACINLRSETVVPSPQTPESLLISHLKEPNIRGIITNVFSTNEQINAIFVDGTTEDNPEYDQAVVQLVDETRIFMQRGELYEIVTSEQLTVGIKVGIIFTGTILERYPPSVTAEEIVILSYED